MIVVCLFSSVAGAVTIKIKTTTPLVTPTIVYADHSSVSGASLAWPATGQASIGAESYGLLESHGTQTPAPTASVAKLITVLCVLNVKPLHGTEAGPSLTIGPADIALYNAYVAVGGSVVPVNSGEQLSERDAIEAILLPSANNIADSLAIWAFGSLNAYNTYANKWLTSHGLLKTHVGDDASGLAPNSTSTANDLVRIGVLATQNPVLANIASLQTAEIPVAGTIHNVNWLLGTAGINGLKTGNSDAAGGTFVFSSSYAVSSTRTITIVGAVLQAATLQQAMNSALALLTSAQAAFTYQPAVAADQVIGQYNLPDSNSKATAITAQSVNALFWRGQLLDKPHVVLQTVQPPKPAGAPVGVISFGNQTNQSSKVILSEPLPQASLWYRLWH